MLRIAVQAKGRLFEETMALLGESDIKVEHYKTYLIGAVFQFPIEVLFLRDDDIRRQWLPVWQTWELLAKMNLWKRKKMRKSSNVWDSVSVAFHWLCRKILNIPFVMV